MTAWTDQQRRDIAQRVAADPTASPDRVQWAEETLRELDPDNLCTICTKRGHHASSCTSEQAKALLAQGRRAA